MQAILQKSNITQKEEEVFDMADMGQSTAVMDSEACDEDESANWDPFEDAHKFEALAEKQEQERKK